MRQGIWAAGAACAALLAGAAIATSASAQTAYDTAIENTSGLVGYFPFTQASQANSVVGGFTGTLQGGAAIGGAGTGFGTGAGQSSLVLPNNPNTGSFAGAGGANPLQGGVGATGTVVAWINLASLPSDAGRFFYVAGESQGGDDLDLQVETDNKLRFYTNSGGSVAATTAFDASDVGQWVFVAATYSNSGTTDVYIDGVLSNAGGAGGHNANQADFNVGESTVFTNREFDGSIGGVALFDTQLSAGQVAGLFDAAEGVSTGVGGVPEPAAWSLMLLGFGGLGAQLRAKRRKMPLAA
jgi:hypothetical protein